MEDIHFIQLFELYSTKNRQNSSSMFDICQCNKKESILQWKLCKERKQRKDILLQSIHTGYLLFGGEYQIYFIS